MFVLYLKYNFMVVPKHDNFFVDTDLSLFVFNFVAIESISFRLSMHMPAL